MSNLNEWIRVWVANKLDRNAELRRFVADLVDPERYGHAVSAEVRQKAKELLEVENDK